MEVEASYSYGFLPAGRHQPYGPPPPHPAEDGELWEYLPCPFCYIEVEVPFICNHLQEEHCFDTTNAVCPICADNLGRDMAAHFRVQHSNLLKRRKPSKPSSWPTAANNPASGKESYEVNYMMNRPGAYQDPAPDPLLSQFVCSVAQTDANPGNAYTQDAAPAISDDQRSSQRVIDDASKLELEERLQRIEFLKDILMSTIL